MLEITALYRAVSERLDALDFPTLWAGFSRCRFALYDQKKIRIGDTVLSYSDYASRFIGNTAISFNGEYLAIWDISDESGENVKEPDADLLAAGLVHEMFHAHQYASKDKRFPDDLAMLLYPDDPVNFAYKYAENNKLAQACRSGEAFGAFVAVRKERARRIGGIIRQEYLAETAEGLAEYVGSLALRAFSPEKYKQRIEKYERVVTSLSAQQFDPRRISYYTGTLFFLACEKNGFYSANDGDLSASYFERLIQEFAFPPVCVSLDGAFIEKVSREYDQYKAAKERRFADFLAVPHKQTPFSGHICGYDPMNMLRADDDILCSHFIMLQPEAGGDAQFIKGPVLLKMEPRNRDKVRSYLS